MRVQVRSSLPGIRPRHDRHTHRQQISLRYIFSSCCTWPRSTAQIKEMPHKNIGVGFEHFMFGLSIHLSNDVPSPFDICVLRDVV